MTTTKDFYVGERVRFEKSAPVSAKVRKLEGVVLGYDEIDGNIHVIVEVKGGFDQWVSQKDLTRVPGAKTHRQPSTRAKRRKGNDK